MNLKFDIILYLNNDFGDYFKFIWLWVFDIIKMVNLLFIDCIY